MASTLLVTVVCATAQAQDDPTGGAADPVTTFAEDPGPGCDEKTSGLEYCDTNYTPIAKDGQQLGWKMVSGEVFMDPNSGQPVDSGDYAPARDNQTDPGVDFFTVDFVNELNGLAGGAACEERDPTEAELESCTRVPVIYRYGVELDGIPRWGEVYRGTSPGYVGAISWLTPNTALAVGGNGCYPRREDLGWLVAEGLCPAGNREHGSIDRIAGDGRAWYAESARTEGFREVKLDDLRTDPPDSAPITGLTALDSTSRLGECAPSSSSECAFAGGLRQIWMWKGEHFDQHYTPQTRVGGPEPGGKSDAGEVGGDWLYRVRDIAFRPNPGAGAVAVTSGCCASRIADTELADPTKKEHPVKLEFFATPTPHWAVMRIENPDRNVTLPDSVLSVQVDAAPPSHNRASFLFSPGGAERDAAEPGSYLLQTKNSFGLGSLGSQPTGALGNEFQLIGNGTQASGCCKGGLLAGPSLSAARLVAGGEDLQGHQRNICQRANGGWSFLAQCRGRDADDPSGPNGLMDWAVGELRTTGEPGTRQAVAYTTTLRAYGYAAQETPYPLACPPGGIGGAAEAGRPTDCEPDSETAKQLRSAALVDLPSYSLNAIETVSATGTTWAAGDRGGLLVLGGDAAAATLPPESAPALGARKRGEAPDRAAYRDRAPQLSDEPGSVPSRASRARAEVNSLRVSAYGSPDPHPDHGGPVATMAMSRDGSEGWAVGGGMTLNHFDGLRWTSCRFHRIPGVLDADPACESLRRLRDRGIEIEAIARIPLEYDSDPTNDDEFEAIAAATAAPEETGGSGPTILRYREGEWELDAEATRSGGSLVGPPITDIAFSSPSDGWMIGQVSGLAAVYHFDGVRWMPCTQGQNAQTQSGTEINRTACQDPGTGSSTEQGDCAKTNPGNCAFPAADARAGNLHLTIAGERVYLYGTRQGARIGFAADDYPVILYNDPGRCERAGDSGCWQEAYNPKPEVSVSEDQDPVQGALGTVENVADSNAGEGAGQLTSLSVAQAADGSYTGWGAGSLGAPKTSGVMVKPTDGTRETAILRSSADGRTWAQQPVSGPALELLAPTVIERSSGTAPGIVALPGPEGGGGAVVAPTPRGGRPQVPMVWFDPERERWEVLETPWVQTFGPDTHWQGITRAIAPDNLGGAWLAMEAGKSDGTFFYRAESSLVPEVFEDAPHPIREPIVGSAAGGDGSLWVATASSAIYRYDRMTGWDRMTVPSWDPGRAVTHPSEAHAVAIGPDGEGVVVGKGGRIADVGPRGAVLDAAAGVLCSRGHGPPCGTGRDLRAAAVAPDGSAIVGGDFRSLLWRPADGEFRAITPPGLPAASFATITDLTMPAPDRAWLTTDTGYVFAGTLRGEDWEWSVEAVVDSESIARNEDNVVKPLNAISVAQTGHGYAVGEDGVILEREEGEWRRVDAGVLDDLTSVALAPSGDGVLVGGEYGLVLTRGRDFVPARVADPMEPVTYGFGGAGEVVGVALVPGHEAGQIEAWAASQVSASDFSRAPKPGALLHYSSDPSEPLLDGATETTNGLPDAPRSAVSELSFATFGRSECQSGFSCPEIAGSNLANEIVASRIRDEIAAAGDDGPELALFTGDVGEVAGTRNNNTLSSPLTPSRIHARWSELIAQGLNEGGTPVFGAAGGRDLSKTEHCPPFPTANGICAGTDKLPFAIDPPEGSGAGANLAWRDAMSRMPAPWGQGDEAPSRSGLSFAPVETGIAAELGDQSVSDPTAEEGDTKVPTGGARTHYAFDVERDGEQLLRVVVVDTSLRSLAASNAIQNPVQDQLTWLRDVLASTPQGARKVVVSNTPTYSYGPGAGTDTLIDAAVFEQALMENEVDLVVSGRLGWNGVYWTCAPGLHYPNPGSSHPDPHSPPQSASECALTDSELPDPTSAVPSSGQGGPRPLPVVVASSAGGKFGPQGHDDGTAAEGYWRGYTEIRIDPGSDEPPTILQRPVLDWIGISAKTHALSARQRTKLTGYGREPAGIDVPLRYIDIDSPAITHRYDLLLAHPDEPWVPCTERDIACEELHANLSQEQEAEENPCSPYLCLPKRIGTIDGTTGEARAGDGRYPTTFAIAMLSVNDKVATYAIAFEKSPSFVVKSALRTPGAPPTNNVPTPKPPGQPPLPDAPTIPKIELPAIPAPPAIPNLTAAAPPEPTPPAPPAPPPPSQQPAALDLTVAPPGVSISTPTALIQPPTPPVNPAPPGGARREARQRQAAAQKGGADSGAEDQAGSDTDLANEPHSLPGAEMTRLENSFARGGRARAEPSFSAYRGSADSSPLGAGALYAGGVALLALALAAGWSSGRPTPRRRAPELPAPAWSDARHRRPR